MALMKIVEGFDKTGSMKNMMGLFSVLPNLMKNNLQKNSQYAPPQANNAAAPPRDGYYEAQNNIRANNSQNQPYHNNFDNRQGSNQSNRQANNHDYQQSYQESQPAKVNNQEQADNNLDGYNQNIQYVRYTTKKTTD